MRSFLTKIYEDLRASYWFIPLLLSVLAAALAVVLVIIDARLDWKGSIRTPFFFATQPAGARAVLSAIGGSMIGVAGTVFSVTMAAVVYASGSYGPRLLTNFMTDRGNQVTLGTFTATFVYCILVLRTVREGTAADAAILVDEFVPIIATFGATILGLCSIGVLIYFIHHVPSNIHVSNVVAGIGRSLLRKIGERFPKPVGSPPVPGAGRAEALWQRPGSLEGDPHLSKEEPGFAEIEAMGTGYVQIVDEDALVAAARRHEVVLRLNVRPGAFLQPGRIVFDVFPTGRATEDLAAELNGTLVLGTKRTSTHDLLFLFDELVEIAARALSPGVNDPYTAVNCIDWLGAALGDLAGRDPPDPLRLDTDGKLRVIALPMGFEDYLAHSFGNLRHYAAADMIAGTHFLATLGRIARHCDDPSGRSALRSMGASLVELSRDALNGASLAAVEAGERELNRTLEHPRRRIVLGAA